MDRTLFRTTAMVGLFLSIGVTAAQAGGGHRGGMAAPIRPMIGMHGGGWSHAAYNGGMAYRRMPPVSGVIPARPGYGGTVAGGYQGGSYGYPHGYGYGHGPAVYSLQGGQSYGQSQGYGQTQGYSQAQGYSVQHGGYAMQRPVYGYGAGRTRVVDIHGYGHQGSPYGYRQGGRYGNGRGYGYGYGAAAGAAAGYAVAGGDYGYAGGGYGYAGGGYAGGDYAPSYATSADDDSAYPAPETPLTATYGEPAIQPGTGSGLFGTGGYALDGQIQDVGYGGPTVGGYGFGGAQGFGYGIAPAGGLGVYIPGAYGPGPRVITIPSQYRTGGTTSLGCTCGSAPRS